MGEAIIEGLIDKGLALYFSLYPTMAVELGLHEYDGKLPKPTGRNLEVWVSRVHALLYRLRGHRAGSSLDGEGVEARLLEQLLESGLFPIERMRVHETLPAFYLAPMNTVAYLARDYAPLEHRLGAVTALQGQVPSLLRIARRNLRRHLPRPYVDLGVMIAQGLEESYRTELPSLAEKLPPPQGDEFSRTNEAARRAVARFRRELEAKYKLEATDDFAIGEENFLALLRANEGLNLSIPELKAMGQADLERNEQAFVATAKAINPTKGPMEVMLQVSEKHPTAEGLIPDTQGLLERLRGFLIERRVVSVPSEVRARVTETPAYMRAVASAAMNSPGAFERSDEAYYYITPVEPTWPKEKAEEWLRYMNYAMLKNVSIHEAYPGHYVHFLHVRHRAQGRMPKVFASYAFTEGWAHYTEEMLLEVGYGEGDMGLRLAQLQDALLRNCRYMVAIGLHTEGMTLEGATKFLMEHGFMERLPAEREALRGTFDPGYLSYTLGKLMIMKLRDEYLRRHPGASLGEFHDKLLSFGAPPVGILRQLLIGNGHQGAA